MSTFWHGSNGLSQGRKLVCFVRFSLTEKSVNSFLPYNAQRMRTRKKAQNKLMNRINSHIAIEQLNEFISKYIHTHCTLDEILFVLNQLHIFMRTMNKSVKNLIVKEKWSKTEKTMFAHCLVLKSLCVCVCLFAHLLTQSEELEVN